MVSATHRNARRLLAVASLFAAGGAALLLAGRGEAASPLTLVTISVDGTVGDWDAVLANALQTTRDGDGSSDAIEANCAAFSTDRDCPQPGGNSGNDLHTFAWTYDDDYVYLYVERYGTSPTAVDFFFVADTDSDQRVEGASSSDRVIHARWFNSGTVNMDTAPYVPADTANGDPITSPTGYVDGYDLPGGAPGNSFDTIACDTQGRTALALVDGSRKMELRVPWCAFTFTSARPFNWHVTSASQTTLSAANSVDNIGAPSGGLGSFVQRGVAFFPDRNAAILSPGTWTYDHTVRNDGNEPDTFRFDATSSQGAMVELVVGGSTIGRDDTGDGTWELPASGKPELLLPVGGSEAVGVKVTMPSGRSGTDLTRVTATSAGDPTVLAMVTDSSQVGAAAFVPDSLAAWTQAGVAAVFTDRLLNGQAVGDTLDLEVDDGCLGHELRLTADPGGLQVAATDATGDGSWDTWAPAYDTNLNGLPDFGSIDGGQSLTFYLWVKPPGGAPDGTCQVALIASSGSGASATARHDVTVAPAVTFGPSYTGAAGTARRVGVGETVTFPAVIRNSEGVARSYTLGQIITPSGTGATARVWSDPNGDGNLTDGQVITATGTVQPFGGIYPVVIELLTGTAASGTSLSVATTAQAGSSSAVQTSEATVGYLATYSDPLMDAATSVFAPCSTVYLQGSGLLPSNTTSYILRWLDPAATDMGTVSPWPTTALGMASSSLPLAETAPTGDWIARLADNPGALDQDLAFTVELIGTASVPVLDRPRYRPGDTVQVTGAFQNAGRTALEAGTFRYTLDGVPVRTRSGVTVAAGATALDPFALTLPLGTAPGRRTLVAGWWLSCGTGAFTSQPKTVEVQPDPPALTSPANGARLATHTPVIQGTGVAGAQVIVTIGAASYPPVTVAPDGKWTFTAPPLADGTLAVTASQVVDTVPGADAAPVSFTLDTTPPAVPSIGEIVSPTRADPVPVTVTTDAGSSVAVYANGSIVSTTPASVSGTTYVFELTLGDGTWSIQATAADDLANTSALSTSRSVEVDRTPPAPPVVDAWPLPVNDLLVPVAATAAGGSTVRVFVDGTEAAVMTETTPGRFVAGLDLPLDGTYSVTATAADPLLNESVASDAVTLQVDRTPPAAPVVEPVTTPTAADPVIVTVTAEAGATVTLEVDGAPSGVVPTASGTTYTFPIAVGHGSHTVIAAATDAAGNGSPPSAAVLFDVDRIAPAAPTVEPIATPTNLQPVPVTVTAEAGTSVRVWVDGALDAALPVTALGTSYAFELTLAPGTRSIEATAADPLGNTSARSPARVVVVDRTAPGTPVLTSPIPPATRADVVRVAGTAEAGSTVTVLVSGTGAAPSPAPVTAAGGVFEVFVDFAAFSDDLYDIRLLATDAAGNSSDPSAPIAIRVDRDPPLAPVVGGIASPTSASPLVVEVTAEAGSAVVLSVDGVPQPTLLPVSVAGNTFAFELMLADGGHDVSAVATDAAGNESPGSNLVSFLVDNTLPAIPIVAVTSPTRADPVVVTVTAEPVSTVLLYVDGLDSGVAPSVSGGTYTFSLTLAEGSYVLHATAQDAALNVSPPSASHLVEVDRTGPATAPSVVGLPAATRASALSLTGTTDPGATVWFAVGTLPLFSVTADALGSWSASVPLPGGAGPMTVPFDTWATDEAGNSSPTAAASIAIDRAPPAAPVITPISSPTRAASLAVVVTVLEADGVASVQLFVDGAPSPAVPTVVGTAWTFAVDPGEGTFGFTATATDAVGNLSAASAPITVEVDRAAPAVPSIGTLASPTRDASLSAVVSVAGAAATDTVALFLNGSPVGTVDPAFAVTRLGDLWTFTFDPGEGTTTLVARSSDALGNTSAASGAVTVLVDRTAPPVPSIAAIASPTNSASVTAVVSVAGAEAGDSVALLVDGADVATVDPAVVVSRSGATWTFTFDPGEGSFDLTAVASDALGNGSAASAPRTVEVDRTAPTAPVISPIVSPTSAARLLVAVGTDAGATVRLFVDGVQSAALPAYGAGSYTFDVDPGEGTFALTATAADALGNTSSTASPTTVEIDRSAPGVPAIAPIVPNPTSAPAVTVVVTADPGSLVVLFVDGAPSAATPAVSGGTYTFSVDPGEGSSILQAAAADALGNTSALSAAQPVVVDRTAPAVPTVAAIPTPTNAAILAVSVTAEAGSTVRLWVDGVATAHAPTIAGTIYSFAFDPGEGSFSIQATAADALGNSSARSVARSVTVDRTAPSAAPTFTGLPAVTRSASVALAGTADAGTTVTISVAGMAPVTAVASAGGAWSANVPLPLSDGPVAVTFTAADAAGNLSPIASGSVIVDRTGPAAAPTISGVPAVTGAASLAVSGTTEAGATVTVTVEGLPPVTATADVAGSWSADLPLPVSDGTFAISIAATDAAGNGSPAGAASVTVDRTSPDAPVITAPAEGAALGPGVVAITGTAEAGGTVTVVVDGATYTAIADAASGAFQVDVTLAAGNHFVTATVTDAAGNTSAGAARTFAVSAPPDGDGGGGGCGCAAGGGGTPEGLLLLGVGLAAFRRRRRSA